MFSRISLFFLFIASFVVAQDTYIRPITFRDGLTTQSIYNLFVDQFGLLYLGTDKGLMAYDGVKFKEFNFEEGLSISTNNIQQDYRGVIWCKNFSNEIFYLNQNLLQQDATIKKLIELDQSNVVGFVFIKNQMWIATEKNLYMRAANGSFKKILALDKQDLGSFFTALCVDKFTQKVYVLSSYNSYVFNDGKLVNEKRIITGQKEAVVYKFELFFNLKGMKNEIYNADLKKVNDLNTKNIFFNKLSVANNQLWICTAEGVYEFDEKQWAIKPKYLINKNTTDIVEDKEGNLWISTLNEGLFMLPDKDINFFKIKELPENINYSSIQKFENKLYIGTSKGNLLMLNEKHEIVKKVDFKTQADVEFIKIIDNNIFSTFGAIDLTLNQFLLDKYLGKYIDKINPSTYLYASYNSGGIYVDTLKITPDELKSLNQRFKNENYLKSINIYNFRNKRARCVLYDANNQEAYIGFSDGLFVYDENYKELEIKYLNKPIIASRIEQDRLGNIWVATSQNGLFHFKNNQLKKHYTINDGLSSNQCKRLSVQTDGLWILTTNGINFLSFADYQIKNLNQNLNFTGVQINDFVSDNGQLYFATNNGIFYFSQEVFNKKTPPSFLIKDVFVNNNRPQKNQNKFSHDQNNITFVFQSIHYKSLGDYKYLYRLKPINDKWESQQAINQEVKYLSLKPGDYQFEAKVDLKDGASKVLKYNFTIEKPFWQRAWFILLMILVAFGLVYFIYQLASRRIRKKEAVKLQFAMSQLTALRSQMNPHFLFNILNAVQGLIYSNQKAKANEYLGTFSDLIRKTLDFSDQVEITLAEELEATELYIKLEQSRFEEGDFFYDFQIENGIDPTKFFIPSLIIQPFVENAIKHGLMHKVGLKKLIFTIKKSEDYLNLVIDDNGIGRIASEELNKKMKKHQSFATKAIQNRIELLNKISPKPITFVFEDKTQPQTGTRVVLKIPIKEKRSQNKIT